MARGEASWESLRGGGGACRGEVLRRWKTVLGRGTGLSGAALLSGPSMAPRSGADRFLSASKLTLTASAVTDWQRSR